MQPSVSAFRGRSVLCRYLASSRTPPCTKPFSSKRQWESLENEIRSRHIPVVHDYLTPRESFLLNLTLSDHLPRYSAKSVYDKARLPSTQDAYDLPPSHHMVYFPPTMPNSKMLPDGTDPLQSPQGEFTRRMWAGGEVHFNSSASARLKMDGSRVACVDSIENVAVKRPDSETPLIFVSVERQIGRVTEGESDDAVRKRLGREGEASTREIRNLVFMKPSKQGQHIGPARTQQPEHQGAEDFSHVVEPDAKLLFRYSALTFNAHAIHLDPEYCKQVEGLRGLLFHGPLCLTFFCTLLRLHLIGRTGSTKRGFETLKSIKYRNTHPLFCNEPVRFSGKQTGSNHWTMWAETPEGSLAATADIVTEQVDWIPGDVFEDVRALNIQ